MVQFLDPEIAKIQQFLDPEIVKIDKKIYGSRNPRNGVISGSRNRRKGRQILYHFSCRKSPKPYLAKVDRSAQKPWDIHLSRPQRQFWGLLAAILDFAGGSAL